jgi:ABC-2 type transport system permease protein
VTEHALERAGARATRSPSGWLRLTWRQYRLERRMFWRNPTAAFFNFLFPLIFLGLFGAILSGNPEQLRVIVPGIAGMSVMSTTFTALAFNLTFLREQGILKRIRGTPLPTSAYFGGIATSAVTNTALQMVIITVSGGVLFGVGWPDDVFAMAVFVALGVLCFASLGVALSHAIPNFESAPAYVNAVFLPVIFISGVFFDVDDVPTFIKDVAQALPLKHLIDGLSGAMVHNEGLADHGVALLVLAAWSAVGVRLAVRGFSWEARGD